ncbi:hypothetical protein BT69DRAFT_310756 [Atractiella rhizophila]|nr:hypothetical protein BT69DRAFT_310756 [Atractiella rhizophila]
MAGPLTSPVLDVFNIEWQDFPVMEEVAEAKTLDTCDLSEEQKVALAASAVEWLEDQLAVVLDTVLWDEFLSSCITPILRGS